MMDETTKHRILTTRSPHWFASPDGARKFPRMRGPRARSGSRRMAADDGTAQADALDRLSRSGRRDRYHRGCDAARDVEAGGSRACDSHHRRNGTNNHRRCHRGRRRGASSARCRLADPRGRIDRDCWKRRGVAAMGRRDAAVDAGTRIRIASATELDLQRGAVYVASDRPSPTE